MDDLLVCKFAALVLVISFYAIPGAAENYYVRTTSNTRCPEEETVNCLTLNQYATKQNNFFTSNTTIILLPGKHRLDSNLTISNITYLHVGIISPSLTTLTCGPSARFNFKNIEQVIISGMTISGCVTNTITSVDQLTVEDCTFNGQERNGTGLDMDFIHQANITDCCFSSNSGKKGSDPFRPWIAIRIGGAMIINHTNVSISNTNFTENKAQVGGAVISLESVVQIKNCRFHYNTAAYNGGAVSLVSSNVTINGSIFFRNTATKSYGGAVHVFLSSFIISNCTFMNNTAKQGGGAVNIFDTNKTNIMINNEFMNNNASFGSAMTVEEAALITYSLLNIHDNQCRTISVFDGNITFTGHTYIKNNTCSNSSKLQQNIGAITSFSSKITLNGAVDLSYNSANQGGAISAIDGTVNFNGNISVSYNEATTGGGIYAYRSALNFWEYTNVSKNAATKKGGGIYSVSTTVSLFTNGFLLFTTNSAMEGGGLFLEANAKLYIIKENTECITDNHTCFTLDPERWMKIEFKNNSADYGGAIYVSDDTASGTCNAVPFQTQSMNSECFLQGLALHRWFGDKFNLCNMYFTNNSAQIAGKSLFGGLLDRCTVSPFAEIFRVKQYRYVSHTSIDAISYFLHLTNIPQKELQSEVTSEPVRVCFCKNNQPDCSYQPPSMVVRKGETFNVSLVAVDQVNNIISYTNILHSIDSDAELGDRCANQQMNKSCTTLCYKIFSTKNTAELSLHARGPCKDSKASKRTIVVKFKSCPIGFQENAKQCKCDPVLYPKYVINCSINHESVLRREAVWISILNSTDQQWYAIYPNCPFDYCHPSTVLLNLNVPNGADAQCAFSRSGILCGSCKKGLSLSLGSSHCKKCSNNWLALLIVFALAGIALVIFVLALNLTVAFGTINSLIFYANIISTNSSIFFPFNSHNILTVFIAWINLDFGFKTCFYDGMDAYAKTWLQFAFPLYILLLVILIIVMANYSQTLTRVLANKNPVATLATLVLLSYSKLLYTVLSVLSFGNLQYSNATSFNEVTVWLVDGKIGFFDGKHIPLSIAALLVLLVGLAYTLFLFFWQWIQQLSNLRCFFWLRSTKLNSFMDAYLASYNKQHRFWAGLLLLTRIILYLIATALKLNITESNGNSLLAVICAMGALLLLKALLRGKVYKKWLLNTLESSFILNIIIFACGTLYISETGGNQAALAYTSTTIAFLTFLAIFAYHAYISFKPLQIVAGKIKELTSSLLKTTKRKKTKSRLLELQDLRELQGAEDSGDFANLRESILDDSIPGNYNLVKTSSPEPVPKQCVTYTEIGGIS